MIRAPHHRLLLFFTATALACAGGDDDASDALLDPPPPGQGVQVGMTTAIPAGQEAEHCQFVQPSEDAMWVSRDEARFTTGSHHVLLYEADYDAIPTEKVDGTQVDTGGVFDCSDGATNGWRIRKLVAGSQNATGDSMLRFPEGVAMPVRARAVLLINAHYINASDAAIEPEVRINLHTVAEEEVEVEGDVLFLYNPLIRVPARGSSRARWNCPVHQDITIANAQSHMHARGIGYAATVAGREPFYENDTWSDVEVRSFEPGYDVPAGARLDYYCDYQNGEDRDVYQGPRSTDEMCMLVGSYYPADPRTSNCRDRTGQALGGEWIGEGSATCAETLGCLMEVAAGPDRLRDATVCMQSADPEASAPTSALFRCFQNSTDPAADCAAPIADCLSI